MNKKKGGWEGISLKETIFRVINMSKRVVNYVTKGWETGGGEGLQIMSLKGGQGGEGVTNHVTNVNKCSTTSLPPSPSPSPSNFLKYFKDALDKH